MNKYVLNAKSMPNESEERVSSVERRVSVNLFNMMDF